MLSVFLCFLLVTGTGSTKTIITRRGIKRSFGVLMNMKTVVDACIFRVCMMVRISALETKTTAILFVA